MPLISRIYSCLLASFIALAATTTLAQDSDSFELQLNSAADTSSGSCRLTYVATNRSDENFERILFELGVFDTDGAVTQLLAFNLGDLIAGKTKIIQFDLADSPCADISRIVVNRVAACTLTDGRGESDLCISSLAASSRTAIQFGI